MAPKRPILFCLVYFGNFKTIDLIHDNSHPFTRLRTDGIKAMSRGFSGEKQVIKSGNTRNRRQVSLF